MHSRMSREICFPATTVAVQKDAPGMMIENDEATTKTHSGVQLAHTIYDKACLQGFRLYERHFPTLETLPSFQLLEQDQLLQMQVFEKPN